jgi:tRNA(Leu) C34 or U34 (ribose-2'-O)-methylase TrmL|tara:strand:+ start:1261 stop:1770 length:510 start_codon:yes stop_codon:yes gene_type:complete
MTMPALTIGLVNPKSPTNVGAILRASGCFGVSSISYSGNRLNRALPFNTDTQNNAGNIPLIHKGSVLDHLPRGTKIICVELVEGAIPLPSYTHPLNAYYVFGPEDGSVSQAIIDKADDVVYIPTVGCLNLAATVNVVLYDRLAKAGIETNDALIIRSRDANNHLRVKVR